MRTEVDNDDKRNNFEIDSQVECYLKTHGGNARDLYAIIIDSLPVEAIYIHNQYILFANKNTQKGGAQPQAPKFGSNL